MTGLPLTPEQMALLAISRTCWRRRGIAKARKLFFSEESVTETILMDLAEIFPGDLAILPFNKNEEGETGADWAWAISNADGTANLPMLVQAKALDLADHAYAELKRTIGKQVPKVRQIDRLLDTAQILGWPAIYAFYNHLTDVTRLPKTCQTLPMIPGPIQDEAWGISFADAAQVRVALDPSNDQTFDSHCVHSRPLICLLCSGGSGARPPRGSPEAVFSALQQLRAMRRHGDAGETELVIRSPEPVILPRLPLMFAEAEAILADESPGRRQERIQVLSQQNPGLAGVMILRDSKDV